jgi:hypothetical protein
LGEVRDALASTVRSLPWGRTTAQGADKSGDLTGFVSHGDQNRVIGRHHDEILDADRRDQLTFGPDVGVAHAFGHDVAVADVAVALADVAQGLPRVNVALGHVDEHNGGAPRVFDDRVID